MSCWEKEMFKIYEWSDTELEFYITEKVDWEEKPVDLTEYDKVQLTIKYCDDSIREIEWEVDWEDMSCVLFTLLSENTIGKSWMVFAEIWWIKDSKKVRLSNVFVGEILYSIKIPEWIVENW